MRRNSRPMAQRTMKPAAANEWKKQRNHGKSHKLEVSFAALMPPINCSNTEDNQNQKTTPQKEIETWRAHSVYGAFRGFNFAVSTMVVSHLPCKYAIEFSKSSKNQDLEKHQTDQHINMFYQQEREGFAVHEWHVVSQATGPKSVSGGPSWPQLWGMQ